MRAIHVVMALLLIVPILINFYTPLYNYVNPKFEDFLSSTGSR